MDKKIRRGELLILVYSRITMKISLDWLSDFVTWTEKDPHVIANQLTLCTAEVEEVEEQGKYLRDCCVGEILTIEKHPQADRLNVCTIQTDRGIKTIVCGGTNLRVGMPIAFAHVGATVKHGDEVVTLEPIKIRGVQSEGMICAAEELDLQELLPPTKDEGERPVMDLSKLMTAVVETSRRDVSTITAGQSLREAFGLTDTIFHINNTAITTRPDLFSHIGFARECVALGLAEWKKNKSDEDVPAERLYATKKSPLKLIIDCPDLVPRYLGCMVEIDSLGETPDWMKKRLAAVGVRSINVPVDITNYVAWEQGVPLHSFDADDIRGDVHMRLAKKGEKITTLDDVERELPDGAMILSDDEGVFDLLGIMGGLRSSTKPNTKYIYLHAASLDPASIRRAVLAMNHRTDAATVYEKCVPPITTEKGFMRALELMLELIPGAKIVSALESKGDNGKAPTISLSLDRVQSLIGADIPEKTVIKILEDLECTVVSKNDNSKEAKSQKLKAKSFIITPPLHRLRDIKDSRDLIEEIGRIYGYANVENVMPMADIRIPERDQRIHNMRDTLKAINYIETVPLSFTSKQLLEKSGFDPAHAIEIENPLGDETALLQTSTLPQLLAHAEKNLLQAGTLRTFHWSHVFEKGKPEHLELSMLLATREETKLLDDPFLLMKEEMLRALKAAGYDLTIAETKDIPAYAHPGRIAAVMFGKEKVGDVFEVHPTIRKHFDLPNRAAAAIINLHALLKNPPIAQTIKNLSLFPAVVYDVTITRTQKDSLDALLKKAQQGNELLESIVVQDLYSGKPLTDGQYNLTLRFTYRSQERTLTEEEAKAAHEKVMANIEK